MRYKKYQLRVIAEQKKLKKSGYLRNKPTPDNLLSAIAQRNAHIDSQEPLDALETELLEIEFIRRGRPTVFPESCELVDALIRSSFRAVDETAFPVDIGLIMMPKEHRLPSYFYAITNSDSLNELYIPYYDSKYSYIGFPKKKIEELKERLVNAYQFPHKILRIGYYTESKKFRTRTTPVDATIPILATDPNALSTQFKTNESNEDEPFESDKEVQDVNEMIRFALAQIVYQSAKPDLVEYRAPDIKALEAPSKTDSRLLRSFEVADDLRDATLVGWFFRQLRDPKYYNGKFSDYPIGSRWSFVKPHLRGGTAKTIKRQNENP